MEDSDDLQSHPVLDQCFLALKRARYVIIVVWFAALLWGAFTGEDYIKLAQDTSSAPKGTRTYDDYVAFQEHFPEFANQKVLIMLVQCLANDCTIVCPSSRCKRGCRGDDPKIADMVRNIAEQVSAMAGVTSSQSYFNFSGTVLDNAKCSLASPDGRSTITTFTFANEASNPERHTVINSIKNKLVPQYNLNSEYYRISVTGFDALAKDGSEDAIMDVVKIDIFTLPVAFALLGYMVRSWRLLLLAGINTGATMAFSFAFLAQVSRWSGKKPLSTASSLVEVLGVAMSVDYSLFLLRRFRDELKNKRSVETALKLSVMNAGHVVLLSSLTFACVFVGFLFLPSDDLQGLAQASLVAILTALIVCMSNTPAMIFAFPSFFSGESEVCTARCFRGKSSDVYSQRAADVYDALMVGEALLPSAEMPLVSPGEPSPIDLGRTVTGKRRHRRGAKYSGCYFRFLKLITAFPFNILFVIVVYGLSIPVALRVLDLEHNQDVSEAISRSAPSAKTFRDLTEAFPGGILSPFYVVIDADHAILDKQEGPVLFKAIHRFVKVVADETGVDASGVVSPATLQGKYIDYSTALQLLNADSFMCKHVNGEACAMYSYLFNRFTAGNTAVLIMFTIAENPYGPYGRSFIEGCLRAMDSGAIDTSKYHIHLSGDEVLMNADQDVAFGAFPALLATTITIIFLLLGFGFQSIMTPIRLSFTVFLPISTVFGFAVMVYQDGILDWLGIAAVHKREQGFFWYIPIVCLLQALGLTIDYDVFSFSRIAEHRADGYEIRAAIIKAVWEVSSTICTAGLIMAAVFSGLLLGESTAVNQFGFLLCTSVLVDTFIVQSLLVPAIVSIGDSVAWFPRRMPQSGLITLDDPEFNSD